MQRNPGNVCLPTGIVYDLFSDPGENRHDNINYTGSTTTAANYMSTATVTANRP